MAGAIDARLKELGIELPAPAPAAANYVPYAISGNQVFVAGQVPFAADGKLQHVGKVGAGISIEDGQMAAKLCALNILAQVKAACHGNLERVVRCVKLGGFVNCPPDFEQHPAVINGASDLMVQVLGERGRHARFAVGASNLPFNVAVEVDAIFEIV
ncbi:RidA family protein [bacterium AH-315-P15]|nr:RidA family protein [bacterium AH-315-P15]